jgi:hypothetical protein
LLMYDSCLIQKRSRSAAVWAALAIWVRPDAVLAVLPLWLYTAWKNWRPAFSMAFIISGILLPWLIWSALYFGSPIPQSILAKHAMYSDSGSPFTLYFLFTFLATGTLGPYHQLDILFPGSILGLFLTINGLFVFLRRRDPSIVFVIYPLFYAAVMIQQQSPMFFSWYYVPLMPGLLLLFWGALQSFTSGISTRWRGPVHCAAAVMLIALPLLYIHAYPNWSLGRVGESSFQAATRQVKSQVQDQQVVFAPDIGVIGWELSNAYILDSVGLVSPNILHYYDQIGDHNHVNPTAIAHFRPDFVITSNHLIHHLLSDPTFTAEYRLVWPELNEMSNASVYALKP